MKEKRHSENETPTRVRFHFYLLVGAYVSIFGAQCGRPGFGRKLHRGGQQRQRQRKTWNEEERFHIRKNFFRACLVGLAMFPDGGFRFSLPPGYPPRMYPVIGLAGNPLLCPSHLKQTDSNLRQVNAPLNYPLEFRHLFQKREETGIIEVKPVPERRCR